MCIIRNGIPFLSERSSKMRRIGTIHKSQSQKMRNDRKVKQSNDTFS